MPPPPMVPGKHNLDATAWEPSQSNASYIETVSNKHQDDGKLLDDNEKLKHHCLSFFECNEEDKLCNNCAAFDNNKKIMIHHRYQNDISKLQPEHSLWQEKNSKMSQNLSNSKERTNSQRAAEDIENNDKSPQIVLNELKDKNNYNPPHLNLTDAMLSRFFVIKSYSEDDIHRSIKYEIWCSTDHGNKRLDDAFRERKMVDGTVLLFFSVNGSGHFCGMAQMMTEVDYNSTSSVWSQDKWKGKFKVKWIYVKDVPNGHLRHIKLENNDNKSVTHSRDTQEIPHSRGLQVLKILHSYNHLTSIFDDFYHYEKKQEEEFSKRPFENTPPANLTISKHRFHNEKVNKVITKPRAFQESCIEINSSHRRCHSNTFSKHLQYENSRTISHDDHKQMNNSDIQFIYKSNENNNIGHYSEEYVNAPIGSQTGKRHNSKECDPPNNPKIEHQMFKKKI